MEKAHSIKGIRLRTLNTCMLLFSIILFIIVFYTTYQISEEYNKNIKFTESFLKWNEAERTVSTGTTYLTDQARLYVQTHDKIYADNFFRELFENDKRNDALIFLSSHEQHAESGQDECYLKNALDLSNALGTRETYAIRLVAEATGANMSEFNQLVLQTRLSGRHRTLSPEEKLALARTLVFGTEYQKTKQEIAKQLNLFLNNSVSFFHKQQLAQSKRLGDVLAEQRISLFALFFINILIFTMIIMLIIKPLQIYLHCIKNDKMLEMVGAYEFKHLAFTYNDIFALKEHHEKVIMYRAEHDHLTGLYNRDAFDSIKEMLKKSYLGVGILLIDVDYFKSINDTYGHAVGDKALCRIASLLKEHFRSDDYCIRFGGDEFAVIVTGKICENKNIIKNKITQINNELQNPPADLPKLSVSVGVAFSKTGFNNELMEQADIALYKVKEAGRCGCCFFDPSQKVNGGNA